MKSLSTHFSFLSIPSFVLLLTFISLATSNCSSAPDTRPSPLNGQIDLQGHRGARGLKPENTWPSFESALQYEMTTLELDTVLTKDKKVIIHHDSETNPAICQTKEGAPIDTKSLYDLNLSDLKKLDCGAKKNPRFPEQVPVPGTELITIDEFFIKVAEYEKKNPKAPKVSFNIETKFPANDQSTVDDSILKDHVHTLVAEIEKAKMVERTTVQSFYLPALPIAKAKNPKLKISALFAPTKFQGFMMILGFGDSYRSQIIEKAEKLKADIISPYFLYITPSFVDKSHKKNIAVIPWTINDEKEMKRVLECGVDGVISDYPDRLIRVFKEYKSSLVSP